MHTTAWIYHNTRPRINKYTPHEEYTSQAWLHSTTWWNTPGRIHATTLIHTTGWIQVKEDYTSWPWTHITVWLHTLGWIHDTAKIHTLGAMHASGWIQTIWTIHVTAWNHTVACTYTTGRISICATASCNFVRSSRFQLRMWLKNLHKTKK